MKQFKINTYIILVGALMMISSQSIAQKSQMNLVNKEFDKYAFMDAREVLLKLTDEGFESDEVFKSLADTYYYNSQYDMAAIWYDRLISNYPEDLEADYFFKAAISNKSLGNYEKSNELMKRYAVLSSDVLISSDFNSNPNYKDSIMSSLDNFEISKVRINSDVYDFERHIWEIMYWFTLHQTMLLVMMCLNGQVNNYLDYMQHILIQMGH